MMKLKKRIILGLCTVVSMSSFFCVSAKTPQLIIANNEFVDSDIFIDENDRAQLPLRTISEILGFNVEWEPDTYTITLTKDDIVIILEIGNNIMKKNDNLISMDTAPKIIDDKTYIPLRYVSEAFGYTINYNPEKHMISVTDSSTGLIEIVGDELPTANINPRGLFAQDFSSVSPTPLAEEWYTEENIPENIEKALNGYVGYTAELTDNNDQVYDRKGSYFLGDGVYKQDFSLRNYLITTDKQFVVGTGRMAIMIESEAVSDDDLYIAFRSFEIHLSPNGIQPFLEKAWHKVFSEKAVIVLDKLDTDKYYAIELHSVAPKEFTEEINGTITIAQF